MRVSRVVFLRVLLPGAVGVQRVEQGVLDGRVVDGQLRVDQHQIVAEQSEDSGRQGPHLHTNQTPSSREQHLQVQFKLPEKQR